MGRWLLEVGVRHDTIMRVATGSGKRSIGRVRGRVDHHEADATGAGSIEHATDARCMGADHHGLIRFPIDRSSAPSVRAQRVEHA